MLRLKTRIINKLEKVLLKNSPFKADSIITEECNVKIESKDEVSLFEKTFLARLRQLEAKILELKRLRIYCVICGKRTNAIIKSNVQYNSVNFSLREGVTCSKCNTNSRLRLAFDFLSSVADKKSLIYLNEQHTRFSRNVQHRFPQVICSSYISTHELKSGDVFTLKNLQYRYEDFTQTSFGDNFFDCILTCDVLEHVPNYIKALSESYRILKPGGTLLLQVPVFGGLVRHNVRAKVQDKKVINLLDPEIHGDPNSSEGILAFYNFSFNLIDDLKKIGFMKVSAQVYHSTEKGYFTDNHPSGDPYPTPENWGLMLPVVLVAVK